jgi:MFS family permease
MLPQTTGDEHRTTIFAAYNLVGSLAGALGALAVSLPFFFGVPTLVGYRLLVRGYVFAALILFLLFGSLSPEVEVTGVSHSARHHGFGVHRSRAVVAKLATLFAIDSFAGGFIVQSLVAYWFYLRYGVDTKALGSIFFGANFLAALSFLLAPAVARRIGLLNTMVSAHLLSNILLLLVPLMPNLELTVGVFLARHLLSQLDVPTRQSYTIAIVDPDERSAAAGITSVARNAAAAVAPAFTGWMLTVPAVGWPFLIAGGLKIVYDLSIFTLFRNVRPPEEVARAGAAITTSRSRLVSLIQQERRRRR